MPTAASTTRLKPNFLMQSAPFPRQPSPFKQPITNNGIKIMRVSNKSDFKSHPTQVNNFPLSK